MKDYREENSKLRNISLDCIMNEYGVKKEK
jgi:hypothetical protein